MIIFFSLLFLTFSFGEMNLTWEIIKDDKTMVNWWNELYMPYAICAKFRIAWVRTISKFASYSKFSHMEVGNPQVWDSILPMEDLILNLWDDNQQVWYSCVLCLESHHRAPMDTLCGYCLPFLESFITFVHVHP